MLTVLAQKFHILQASIYPSGGIASINIGDSGRNYSTLPQFTGIERSGAGAELQQLSLVS